MANGARLNIKVFGGTPAMENASDNPNEEDLQPKHGKIEEIWNYEVDGRVKGLYPKSPQIEEYPPFEDSSNFICDSLERISNVMREHVRRRMGNAVVVLGSDQGALAGQTIVGSIDPEKLGDASIIIMVSMGASPKRKKASVHWSQAGADLTNATYLTTRDEMKGKVAYYCGGYLLAAGGLKKIESDETTQPFISRFEPVTIGRNPPVYQWDPFNIDEPVGALSSRRNVLLPTGTSARYKLSPGVEAMPVDAISNYENVLGSVEGMLNRGKLQGFIVPAPGKGDFRNIPQDIDFLVQAAQLCLDAGVPFMTISDPHQKHNPRVIRSIPSNRVKYGSTAQIDNEAILKGTPLNIVEAKVVMSESVHYASKKLSLQGSDLVEYVNEDITEYRRYIHNLITHDQYMEWKRGRRTA